MLLRWIQRLLKRLALSRIRLPRDLLRWAVRRHGARDAVRTDDGERVTFEDLGKRVFSLADGLLRTGLAPGDRVAFLLPNCLAFVELRLACLEAGLTAVPLIWDLSPRARCVALEAAEPKLFFFDPALLPDAADVENSGLRVESLPAGDRRALDSLRTGRDLPLAISVRPGDVATINFTSGTTGDPKGVTSTHEAWRRSVEMTALAAAISLGGPEAMLHAVPLATAGWGGFLPALLGGITSLLSRSSDSGVLLDFAVRERATRAFLTPSQLIDWLDNPGFSRERLASLRKIYTGTAAFHGPRLAETRDRLGPVLQQGYGLAEVLPPVAMLAPEEMDSAFPYRAGRVAPGVSVRVADETGVETAPGTQGEVWLKSPTQTRGYWRREDLTRAAVRDGWFRTGDNGFFGKDGFLHVIGRASERISGLAEHPREIEELAHAHPSVKECALVAIDGSSVLAYSLRRGRDLAEADLENFIASRSTSAKKISCRLFPGDLPRSAAGKIVRGRIAAELTRERIES